MSVSQRDPSMVAPSVDACANIFTSFSVVAFSTLAQSYLIFPYLLIPPPVLDFSVLAFSYAPNRQPSRPPLLNFKKMSISPDWMKMFPPNWWTDASRPYRDGCKNKNRNRKLIRVTPSYYQIALSTNTHLVCV